MRSKFCSDELTRLKSQSTAVDLLAALMLSTSKGVTRTKVVDETEFVAQLTEADRLRLIKEAEQLLAVGGKYLLFTNSQGVTMLLRISRVVDPKNRPSSS